MTAMKTRYYDIVAMSMPIVYTLEGDHDRDGLIYALRPVAELLKWAKARWRDGNEWLPRMHVRRQRIQLVVDGLERLELMLERLRAGGEDEHAILIDLIRREESSGSRRPTIERHTLGSGSMEQHSPRIVSMRRAVTTQVEDIVFALKELEASNGLGRWRQPERIDEETLQDPTLEIRPRLVTLCQQQRLELRLHWHSQGILLDDAIEQWLQRMEKDPDRGFYGKDPDRGLYGEEMKKAISSAGFQVGDKQAQEWIERLLLNDHKPGSDRGQRYNCFNPVKPIPCVRPLVLRCNKGDRISLSVENLIKGRTIGFHLQGTGLALQSVDQRSTEMPTSSPEPGPGVFHADGGWVGDNQDSRIAPDGKYHYQYEASEEGVWPFNDLADVQGNERGSNVHGLFGVLIVEPAETTWCDPESGDDVSQVPNHPLSSLLDLDIRVPHEQEPDQELNQYNVKEPRNAPFVDFHHDAIPRTFREFTVFIHDEPEVHSGLHTTGEHTVMPLSYRAEPMHNRLPHRMRALVEASRHRPLPNGSEVDRNAFTWTLGEDLDEQFWTARTSTGEWLERVAGEEQHHSSWLFGDPITHVLRAYRGDPCRLRLVHAGVKETHVFHLHVHQWRAVAADVATPSTTDPIYKGSQLLDSITISPQCAMTIDPLYGSGSRQKSIGDIIWHCHLYPHFHHGMWGLWRSYDRLVDGSKPYPDGSYCPPLNPLPGRRPQESKPMQPGFPWFIDGIYPMKSPPPPVGDGLPLNGRRALLRMPRASALEWEAMPESCRQGQQPGSQFVDLDGLAEKWNTAAGLPHPRKLSYDIEVVSSPALYNVDGWHDPRCHHYRLRQVQCREWSEEHSCYELVYSQTFDHDVAANPTPLFPRANHGDIVEWRHFNRLGSFPADGFDLAMHPVECGLHVHLVKFDPLSADGSATGWNYLSGASCREAVGADGPGELRTVSLHRWVVDEEFGPCFFHDHLLANFRQKHGLFAALIAEPHGSQWTSADDQGQRAWGESEVVIVPPTTSGLPSYREACLAIGDFIPLLDRNGRTLNPPSVLSGDDDPGSMGVNYRSAPLTFRGPDPSQWFSSAARSQPNFNGSKGDPDTPIIRTYPGERLRVRLIQGSHEEQHGFCIHGMRWRKDWGNPRSTLVNQQTLGISEAFTIDINPTDASLYGPGDHLWHFCAIDDIWLGCWGLIRSLQPTNENLISFAPLPYLDVPESISTLSVRDIRETSYHVSDFQKGLQAGNTRTYVVVARRVEQAFHGTSLTDPWGLTYSVVDYSNESDMEAALKMAIESEGPLSGRPDGAIRGQWPAIDKKLIDASDAPLVLRVRRGEWLRIILVNNIFPRQEEDDDSDGGDADSDNGFLPFGVEPSPARLPLESLDEQGRPDRRTVSPRVSLHASLLLYDVTAHDGSWVGRNPDGTVSPAPLKGGHNSGHFGGEMGGQGVVHRQTHHGDRNWREYWWYADDHLAPASCDEGPGHVCYLYDMADLRNHRHHGLIGAVIVESPDATPFSISSVDEDSQLIPSQPQSWTGLSAEIRNQEGNTVAYETAVFLQDGLRFFCGGNPLLPLPDVEPDGDPEDSGQKAINYRSQPVFRGQLSRENSSTFPLTCLPARSTLWLRVIGSNDKPRQFGITVHGCRWPQANYQPGSAMVSSISGISPCRVETIALHLHSAGDYAIRTGNFRWAAEQGVWSSVRAKSPSNLWFNWT